MESLEILEKIARHQVLVASFRSKPLLCSLLLQKIVDEFLGQSFIFIVAIVVNINDVYGYFLLCLHPYANSITIVSVILAPGFISSVLCPWAQILCRMCLQKEIWNVIGGPKQIWIALRAELEIPANGTHVSLQFSELCLVL